MGQQNRRSDAIEQLGAGLAIDLRDQSLFAEGLNLAGVEGVERRIARRSRSGPLGMQIGLRPKLLQFGCGEALLDVAHRRLARAAIDVAEESRAAAPRLIDDVDGIAVGDEIIGPTAASIRRAQEIRRGLSAAVNHQHRVEAGGGLWGRLRYVS